MTKAKEPAGRVRDLSSEERRALLEGGDGVVEAKDGRSWTVRHRASPTLRLYIVAALHTGARRAELVRLTWADVDMKRKALTFRETKNGRDRTVPMTKTLRRELQALPRPLDAGEPVLPRYGDPRALTRAFARHVERLGTRDSRSTI